jgi:hypothetical protein
MKASTPPCDSTWGATPKRPLRCYGELIFKLASQSLESNNTNIARLNRPNRLAVKLFLDFVARVKIGRLSKESKTIALLAPPPKPSSLLLNAGEQLFDLDRPNFDVPERHLSVIAL